MLKSSTCLRYLPSIGDTAINALFDIALCVIKIGCKDTKKAIKTANNNDNVVTYEEFLSSSCKVVASAMSKILKVLSEDELND